jgi:hypothetical protein
MTPVVDTRAITIHDPTALPWSFPALELVVVMWAAMTWRHARQRQRGGDPAAVLTWTTIVVYGLAMEVISYNLIDNFAHGRFTVMLYDQQLPLYVVAVYPVLLYTGIAAARALRLRPAAEAITAGLLIVCLDVPFDLAGPEAGWWRWFDGDPNIAYRWSGVPVTSLLWHLSFGAILAALTALAARRRWPPAVAPALAIATIVLGVVAFIPFHVAKAAGVADGTIVAAALAAAAVTAAVAMATRRV